MPDVSAASRARPRHRAITPRDRVAGESGVRSRRSALGRPGLVALAVTGLLVGGGSAAGSADDSTEAGSVVEAADESADGASPGTAAAADALLRARARTGTSTGAGTSTDTRTDALGISRGAVRPSVRSSGVLPPDRRGAEAGVSGTARVEVPTDPRDIALAMLGEHGWSSSEFGCLDDLWVGESNWDPSAENPSSGAYGIPQALPAEKMAEAGSDWQTNAATQIEWGLGYISARYGSPCAANSFKLSNGWY